MLDFLRLYQPRIARCDLQPRDDLLSSSRRALFALDRAEPVNILATRLNAIDLRNGNFDEGTISTMFEITFKMCNYLRQVRFLRCEVSVKG